MTATRANQKSIFQLASRHEPKGDQPQAIDGICKALAAGDRHHVLLGVTGSGKTFTMANVMARYNRPTLVMAPNKTLAAQLFSELRELFPHNAVEYFISYYDYYQPEAYVPSTDTYIAKDSAINEDIDKMRHNATMALFERPDVIIVASVSCIYGLGSPSSYAKLVVELAKGQRMDRDDLLRALIDVQYSRNDANFSRGNFRVRGDTVDVLPANQRDEAIRVEFFGPEIDRLTLIDALTGKSIREVDHLSIYPNSHYVTDRRDTRQIVKEILKDLGERLREFRARGQLVEYQRLEQRTMHDIEMFEHLGFCPGIENYSRYLNGNPPGAPPPTLLDYFPKDFLTIIDESHITVPQLNGMFRGDRARKQVLVDHGFRLPSALDNRPLNFDEFLGRVHQVVYVSATPSAFEMQASGGHYSEQIIRPTGLVDPQIEIKPAKDQVDVLFGEIKKTVAAGGRVLITTLTKKMAEDLAQFYADAGIKVRYLHADIESLERIELLRDLRRGDYDVLIGINLLREGLDLPEVQLVAVMDADKEGFLRSRSSLIQIVGRAARNADGRVIFFADRITQSIKECLDETNRRREKQVAYNKEHNISPKTILKAIPEDLRVIYGLQKEDAPLVGAAAKSRMDEAQFKNVQQLEKEITKKTREMRKAAAELDFEKAAGLRDEVAHLRDLLLRAGEAPDAIGTGS
ncbi:excinuclease ABC subunit UvrB [bacterium]|nr:excinuclease ABC subunit UvrB [bacterium]